MGPGDLIGGRFRLAAPVPGVAAGEVHRAVDEATGRPVALKRARTRRSSRVEREVAVLDRLRHPRIAALIAHGTTDDGFAWLATEWIDGVGLDERLDRGPLSFEDAIRLGRGLAQGLAVAHAHGVVHRDVKPGNVRLADDDPGSPVLLDFGVAHEDVTLALTRPGAILGTPAYMAPEQARAVDIVDARADIFSLGAVLYQALTGRLPFAADSVFALLAKVQFEEPRPLRELAPHVPRDMAELVTDMLAKDASNRPADAKSVDVTLARLRRVATLAPPPAAAIGRAELRHVSVVVARAPPPGRAPRFDPSELGARHGADVRDLRDGTLVALFGDHAEAGDGAVGAARLALELRAALDGGVAMATGLARVDQPHPMGEVIDRVGRLLDESSGGEGVRVDAITAQLLPSRFDRGAPDRIVRERVEPLDPPAAGELPFVGRRRELRAIDAMVGDGSPSAAVLLSGEPGSGKSRLLREVAARVIERGGRTWSVRADPMRAAAPFGLAAAILEAGVEPTVRSLAPALQAPTADADAAFLIQALGFEESGEVPRTDPVAFTDRVRRVFAAWLEGRCADGPRVLVIEDLQWADPPSVRLLGHCRRRLRDRPLSIVAAVRSSGVDAIGGALGPGVDRVALGPLPLAAARELAAHLGVTDAGHVERAHARSRGHPFVLGELLRVDDGARLPDTVRAILEARLSGLPDVERRVLRAAGVQGEGFLATGVHALLVDDLDAGAIDAALARLEAQRLVRRRAGSDGWAFQDDALREAAYATLTPEDRRLAHRLFASWLELGRQPAALVAEHHERGDDRARAAPFWLAAARSAQRVGEAAECARCAERALEAGVDGLERGSALALHADARRAQGDLVSAASSAEAALERLPPRHPSWCLALEAAVGAAAQRGDRPALRRLGRALLDAAAVIDEPLAATCVYVAGVSREANERALEEEIERVVLERADAIREHGPRARAAFARMQTVRAAKERAIEALLAGQRAVVLAHEEVGDVRRAAGERANLGSVLIEVGGLDEAVEVLERALADSRALAIPLYEGSAATNLAAALACVGRLDEALAAVEYALGRERESESPRLRAFALSELARLHVARGEADPARRALDEAVAVTVEHGFADASRILATCAGLAVDLGDVQLADALSGQAVDAYERDLPMGPTELRVHLARARALRAAGREASEPTRRALAVLHAAVATVSDAELRRSLLERVPDHRRLLELARDVLGDEADLPGP